MISAFESNGVDAIVKFTSAKSGSHADYGNEAETFAPDATMQIIINPLYRTRKDGYQAIVGTEFEVSLINMETGGMAWHATGKVDYIKMFGPRYNASYGIRKELAWTTTAAVVRAFMADVNDQKSVPIYRDTEARQRYGQRTD